MISQLRLIVWGIAAVAILGAGIYGRAVYRKAERVPELEQAISNLTAQIVNERTQAAKALEKENALQKELAVARSSADSLARRLRWAYRSLPEAPSGPADVAGTGPSGSSPSGTDLDIAVQRFIAAARECSIKGSGWREWYESVPAELK